MESKSITKQFHSYLWAFILVALSACMGNVVDGIIVGNLISEDGVSAINLSKPINQFIFTLHLLINAGAGMLVAFALGRNNLAEARRYFTRALTSAARSTYSCSGSPLWWALTANPNWCPWR